MNEAHEKGIQIRKLKGDLYNAHLLRDSLRRDIETGRARREAFEQAIRIIADSDNLKATELRAIAKSALLKNYANPFESKDHE